MRFALHLKVLPALALAAMLAACASAPARDPMPQDPTIPASAQTSLSLESHDWSLAAAFTSQGAPDPSWLLPQRAPLHLLFMHGQITVQGLCNMVGASYTAQDTNLVVGNAISTKRACMNADLMRLEQRVGTHLPQLRRYQLTPGSTPTLELFFADGSRWEFHGTPTPETRYGGAPEQIFLEVAPTRMACSHGVMQGAECLRVREIHYAANGVKQSVGPWQAFYGDIQGYTHEAGMRNVLRVNRFKRPHPPADASAYAYVLDMMVETERVQR